VALFAVLLLVFTAASFARPVSAATGTLLYNQIGLYPRMIRLAHNGAANGRILASVVSFNANNGVGLIFESSDNGVSFQQVGTIADPDSANGKGLCCATLYELPQQVGNNPAGTLLWSANMGQDASDRRMAIRIWKSNDLGRSWSFLSTCAASSSTAPIWEPEFSIASDGALVCHYSDETDSRYSQKLMRVRSYDGVNWQDRTETVASVLQSDRPGMAVVRTLQNGTYFLTFEICTPGGQYRCVVHYRTSADGWNWGDPTYLGIRPETADGRYFRHTPNIALGPDGKIYLVGQILYNANGTVAAGNGRTIFVNDQNGAGAWSSIDAPVQVPNPYDNFCPNYSSALLVTPDGNSILQIATDYDGSVCKPYFASGPTSGSGAPLANGIYTITSQAGNRTYRLDVDGCNAVNFGKVQLYQPFDNDCQKWRIEGVGGGIYTITSQAGNRTYRLDVDGCNAVNFGKVQLYQPFDNDCQKWQIALVN
jgi:hypothetical protein